MWLHIKIGVGKHYIGPVGRLTGSLSASFQKKLPASWVGLVGRLGSGPRVVADRADVVLANRVD